MRQEIDTYASIEETLELLARPGLLLMTGDEGNPMAIGWGSVGFIWSLPVFTIMVRPSRFSFELLEKNPEFTVNVPAPGMEEVVMACGTRSGRDGDKATALGLTRIAGNKVGVPYLEECPRHYECRSIHTNQVLESTLKPEINRSSYPSGDHHKIWYGEILGVWQES